MVLNYLIQEGSISHGDVNLLALRGDNMLPAAGCISSLLFKHDDVVATKITVFDCRLIFHWKFLETCRE